jgi:hypothetical protein
METAEPKIDLAGTCWHISTERQAICQEMIELEKAFKYCNRDEQPGRWFRLQEDLGDVYRRMMKYYRKG